MRKCVVEKVFYSMNNKKRIVITDDHAIVRDGLKALLSSVTEFLIVGEAEDGQTAIRKAQELKPDLMLLDLSMPRMNGMDAIKEIKNQSPETKVLILTVQKMEKYVHACLKAGADGYVLKDATYEDLISAIHNVLMGRRYLSPDISEKVIEGYLEGRQSTETESAWDTLSNREREILKLIAEGYKNKEIADYLCLSPHTVEKHRDNLMKKLDLHNTATLTSYAVRMGIVTE